MQSRNQIMKQIMNAVIIKEKQKKRYRTLSVLIISCLCLGLSTSSIYSEGITIKAVGDMVPGTNFPNSSRLPKNGAYGLLKKAVPSLEGADILFGNYESTFTKYAKTRKNTKRRYVFAFRAPPSFAKGFKKAGFDILSIANNHSLDFYKRGFLDTAANIEKAGMQHTGLKGDITYIERNNLTIAFIGFSYLPYHNSINDFKGAAVLIAEANRNADIVVVSVHAGAEGSKALHIKNENERFLGERRGNLVKFSRFAIDKGVDLVLGHGPHVPRAFNLYKGKFIAYSLGNFLGYRSFSITKYTGASLVLEVTLNNSGDFVSGKIHPMRLNSSGIPAADLKGRSIRLIRSLTKSDFPKAKLKINADGSIEIKN